MSKAIQLNHLTNKWGIGLDIYPYQIAFGISLRFFESSFALRIYFFVFKIWGYYLINPQSKL
jgi:hypothetical protein